MRVLIFGAGGVGSVVGAFLARTGHQVSLLGRAWHLDVIAKSGLSITGIWGEYRMKAFDLYTTAGDAAAGGPYDLVIVTVKSYDTARAAAELGPLLSEKTVVLSLQNGLGNLETILSHVPADRLLGGRTIFGVETKPGLATVTVTADPPIIVGPAVAAVKPKLSPEQMAYSLSVAKIPTVSVPDVIPAIWAKVVYNCALNAICTLKEIPYGDILNDPTTRADMEAVVRECYVVGAAAGVALDPPTADSYLERLIGTLIPVTAAHLPSMLQDLRRGRRTEIDSLNGAIEQIGVERGVPTPVNARLAAAIRSRHPA